MSLFGYRGRHRKPSPNPLAAPAAVGAATAVLLSAGPAQAGAHTVRRGETLSGLGARYGTTAARIAAVNHLPDPDLIITGEVLRIPGRGGGTRGGGGPAGSGGVAGHHTVQSGENLSTIAARYGVTVAGLAAANHLQDPNLIVTGQTLTIPSGGAALSGAAPAATSGGTSSSSPVADVLEEQAARHGLDDSLVKAVAWQESGWHQDAVSDAGAVGVMQVMPETAHYVNESLGGGHLNVHKTEDNVALGVAYLDHVIDQMPTEDKGLAAYYTGPGNVGRRLTGVQRQYVRSVQALRSRF